MGNIAGDGCLKARCTSDQKLYEHNQNIVKLEFGTQSEEFTVKKGVKQGCVLSPILFNLYGEYIMRKVLEDWNEGVSIGGIKVSNLRFADDIALITPDMEKMRRLLKKLEDISKCYGLQINNGKTKLMVIDRKNIIKEKHKTIPDYETVEKFVYLGSLLESKGGSEGEIKRRIQLARSAMAKLTRIWKDSSVTKNTKIELVRTLIFSIFLYGAETWTIRKSERIRINSFEIWCWRRLLRVSSMEKRTNASILKVI